MAASGKVVVVSQHYPPDPSTTAAIMAEISEHLAERHPVLVLSGTPDSATSDAVANRPVVAEIRNRIPEKGALVRRALAEIAFTTRAFVMVLQKARRGDVVLTVTAPFMLPYAIAFAARLKRAKSALIMHDLYPDVLIMAGLIGPRSPVSAAVRGANAVMFRMLDAVITIGRDTERLLLRYRGVTPRQNPFHPELGDARARACGRWPPTIRIAAIHRPGSSWGFPAISASPTIPWWCSRPRACLPTSRTFISCCRAGASDMSG